MVGKFSCVVCSFEVTQICGESVGVKVKGIFVVEPLGEPGKMPCNTD